MSNKTTGGVWVACSERLPNSNSGLGHLRKVLVRESNGKYWLTYFFEVGDSNLETHWLDTTIPIMTIAEHEAAVRQLRASNAELSKRYKESRSLLKRCIDAFYRDGHEDGETIDEAMSAASSWILYEELEQKILSSKHTERHLS